jgi:hypothetical protein
MPYFSTGNIWSDGDNIYCVKDEQQYILNKTSKSWEKVAQDLNISGGFYS